jgi:uncharacterized HAD superfamily protein
MYTSHSEMTGSADRLVIACDIDEVLFPYLQGYVKYYNRIHNASLKVSDFHSYNFRHVHGHTEEYIADLVYAFHEEPEFDEIEPITGSLEAVHKLQALGELHFVTARQAAIADKTYNWIKKHFGIDQDHVHVGNHWGRPSDKVTTKRAKSEMCKQIGAQVLIDDALLYAKECAAAGMKVFLFDLNGEYGWNKHPDPLHPNITRVHSWDDAIAGVSQIALQLTMD